MFDDSCLIVFNLELQYLAMKARYLIHGQAVQLEDLSVIGNQDVIQTFQNILSARPAAK